MPGGGGFEILREIHALGNGECVPVIAITALVSEADRKRILDAGFHAYLQKPVMPDKLLEIIRSVVALYLNRRQWPFTHLIRGIAWECSLRFKYSATAEPGHLDNSAASFVWLLIGSPGPDQ